MESKQSSLTLPSQDSQGESTLDHGVRNLATTGEEEEGGESSLDKGTRTPVLCTRGEGGRSSQWVALYRVVSDIVEQCILSLSLSLCAVDSGETSLDRGPRQPG